MASSLGLLFDASVYTPPDFGEKSEQRYVVLSITSLGMVPADLPAGILQKDVSLRCIHGLFGNYAGAFRLKRSVSAKPTSQALIVH